MRGDVTDDRGAERNGDRRPENKVTVTEYQALLRELSQAMKSLRQAHSPVTNTRAQLL